jgi:hypothetical protein
MSGDESPNKHFPPTGESRETFESNKFEDDALQRVHTQLMREKEEPSENFLLPAAAAYFYFHAPVLWRWACIWRIIPAASVRSFLMKRSRM